MTTRCFIIDLTGELTAFDMLQFFWRPEPDFNQANTASIKEIAGPAIVRAVISRILGAIHCIIAILKVETIYRHGVISGSDNISPIWEHGLRNVYINPL